MLNFNKDTHKNVITSGYLELGTGLSIHPDLLLSNGNGVFCAGTQGSGKSVILKRILEEVAVKVQCPIIAFDKEEDLSTVAEYFPRGIVGTYHNCPTAHDIYADGLQVVYDLGTWPNMDVAGKFIARLVSQLMAGAESMPFNLRVPCMVVMDEASYWLPQNRKANTSLEESTLADLHTVFESLAARGRKRGLIPTLFTQRFGHVSKDVMSPGTYILLQQIVHTEKKRYLDYVLPVGEFKYYSANQTMQRIGDLLPGEAIVKLANGKQVVTRFHKCQSEHAAHTPLSQAARNRYGSLPFIPGKRYGAFIEDANMEIQGSSLPDTASIKKRITSLLTGNPMMTAGELATITNCSIITARQYRREFIR